jgi:hypothetical protein
MSNPKRSNTFSNILPNDHCPNLEGQTASRKAATTSNLQFCPKILFAIHSKSHPLLRIDIPSHREILGQSGLAKLAERLESFLIPRREVFLDLFLSFFIQVVELNMKACKPLPREAQNGLAG